MIKVSVVDDHKLFRESLAILLETFENVEVFSKSEHGKDFLTFLETSEIHPDIVLLDIQMPVMDGYETSEVLREKYPEIKIIMVSQLTTRESIHKVMEFGVHGFFTKNSSPEDLEETIRILTERDFYLGKDLSWALKELIEYGDKAENPLGILISERELEVIKLAAKEYNSVQIADELNINVRTVETHRKRIMEKTKSKNFIGVIVYAVKNNYLSLDEV
ncbi:response regulator transcription factor [Neptunitalea chrysea]|uniref:Response regulator transcription factor n=1 Tax=Neptunitalea chrysea TaxID=1647581 RepID=A0A9W6EW22_9FLAO|nr:response regulator transcription factor [Neptunitalea chrysea]GLB53257.1 response regulator transcription factor [Neptunitalea chrysea]